MLSSLVYWLNYWSIIAHTVYWWIYMYMVRFINTKFIYIHRMYVLTTFYKYCNFVILSLLIVYTRNFTRSFSSLYASNRLHTYIFLFFCFFSRFLFIFHSYKRIVCCDFLFSSVVIFVNIRRIALLLYPINVFFFGFFFLLSSGYSSTFRR